MSGRYTRARGSVPAAVRCATAAASSVRDPLSSTTRTKVLSVLSGISLVSTPSMLTSLTFSSWLLVAMLDGSAFGLRQPSVALMPNTDLTRLLKSEEIQSVIRKPKKTVDRKVIKPNPLTNYVAMLQLNPFNRVEKKIAQEIEKKD